MGRIVYSQEADADLKRFKDRKKTPSERRVLNLVGRALKDQALYGVPAWKTVEMAVAIANDLDRAKENTVLPSAGKTNHKDPFSLFSVVAPSLPDDYAIGGAFAMHVHGYTRQTNDIDVFMLHTDRQKVLRSLRKRGIIFATLAEPYHYAFIPDAHNPDFRVDLMFTSEDVEMDAVSFPSVHALTEGVFETINVFPLELLVVAKARSDRDKDHDDVRRMYESGMFEEAEIIKMLRQYGEHSPRKMLHKIIKRSR